MKSSLAALFLINVLNFYDRQALSAIVEPLRHEFHLTDAQLGGLVTMFTVIYALAGLPLGRLADTGSRKRLLASGVAVWTGLTAMGALAVNYVTLLATRLGVGIGEAVCAPAAMSWIGDLVPVDQRSRAMAAFMTAVPIGAMLSLVVSGPVAQAWGWRAALLLAAAPGLLLIPWTLALREPARTVIKSARGGSFHSPVFWWITVSGALLNFVVYSFSTFVPAFLTRYHGLSVAQSGIWSGFGSGGFGVLGGVVAGFVGDHLVRTRPKGRLQMAAAFSLVAAVPFFAAIRVRAGGVAASIALLMIGYGLIQTYYGLIYASIQDIVEPGARGIAMATYFVAMYLGGASWGPLLTGKLSDHFAREAAGGAVINEAARAIGLHHAMYVIPALSVALAGVLWAAQASVPRAARVTLQEKSSSAA